MVREKHCLARRHFCPLGSPSWRVKSVSFMAPGTACCPKALPFPGPSSTCLWILYAQRQRKGHRSCRRLLLNWGKPGSWAKIQCVLGKVTDLEGPGGGGL